MPPFNKTSNSNRRKAPTQQQVQKVFESDLAFDFGMDSLEPSSSPSATAAATKTTNPKSSPKKQQQKQQQQQNTSSNTTMNATAKAAEGPRPIAVDSKDNNNNNNDNNNSSSNNNNNNNNVIAIHSVRDLIGAGESINTSIESFKIERDSSISTEQIAKLQAYQEAVKSKLSGRLAKFWQDLEKILPQDGSPQPKNLVSRKLLDAGWVDQLEKIACFRILETFNLAHAGRADVGHGSRNPNNETRMWKYLVRPGILQPPRGLGQVGDRIDYNRLNVNSLPSSIDSSSKEPNRRQQDNKNQKQDAHTNKNKNNKDKVIFEQRFDRYLESVAVRKNLTQKERRFLGEMMTFIDSNDQNNIHQPWRAKTISVQELLSRLYDRGYGSHDEIDDVFGFLISRQFIQEQRYAQNHVASLHPLFLQAVENGTDLILLSSSSSGGPRRRSRSFERSNESSSNPSNNFPLQQQQQQQFVNYPHPYLNPQHQQPPPTNGMYVQQQVASAPFAAPPNSYHQQNPSFVPAITRRIILGFSPVSFPPPISIVNGVVQQRGVQFALLAPPPFFPSP